MTTQSKTAQSKTAPRKVTRPTGGKKSSVQSKAEPRKEPGLTGDQILSDLLKEYARSLPAETKQQAQPEIARFIRWVGDKKVSTLAPAEIGEYSDIFAARATTTDTAERLGHVKAFLNYIRKHGHVEINLAPHLRLRKGRSAASKAHTVPGKSLEVKLTRAGYNDLNKRLSQLQDDRLRLASEIHRAAADKDVRENAPLEAARENQGLVVARIREIEASLKQAVVMDDTQDDRSRVHVGSKVTLKETTTDRVTSFQIVEPNEANPLASKISTVSPVGAAILGKRVGDRVTFKAPSGQHSMVIEKTT